MFNDISYFMIIGRPLVFWLGILSYLTFSFTALIAVLNRKKIRVIPFTWHKPMAIISLSIATIHGLLTFLAYY